MGIPDHLTCVLWNLYVGQEATEPDTEQMTGSKLENEYDKAVCCHPAYLTYMQSTSWESLDWMKHKLEQDFQEKLQPQICKWYPSNVRKWRGTKEPLDEGKRGQ